MTAKNIINIKHCVNLFYIFNVRQADMFFAPYSVLFFSFLIVCLNFITAKLTSKVVSDPDTGRSVPINSEKISPLLCIRDCCSGFSLVSANFVIVCDNSRSFAKASIKGINTLFCPSSLGHAKASFRATLARRPIMAIVAAVACGLFSIVASIYKPFSVKAFGVPG